MFDIRSFSPKKTLLLGNVLPLYFFPHSKFSKGDFFLPPFSDLRRWKFTSVWGEREGGEERERNHSSGGENGKGKWEERKEGRAGRRERGRICESLLKNRSANLLNVTGGKYSR